MSYMWISVFTGNRASLQNSQKGEALVKKDLTCKENLQKTKPTKTNLGMRYSKLFQEKKTFLTAGSHQSSYMIERLFYSGYK